MTKLVTLEDLQDAIPSKRKVITQEAVDIINKSLNDPEFQGESLLKMASIYEKLLIGGNFSTEQYLSALRFCAYISTTGATAVDAYKRTFADRKYVKERANCSSSDSKYRELSSSASAYRRSKLVQQILTHSQIPLNLMFTGERYKAIGVLATIMADPNEKAFNRLTAADKLLTHTKDPENVKIELDISSKQNSAIDQLNTQLAEMATTQHQQIKSGVTDLNKLGALKVKSDIIDAEYEENSN